MKKVAIFCPASPISISQKQQDKLTDFWINKGYQPEFLPHCHAQFQLDTDFFKNKADEIHSAVQDPDVIIMQSFWGGNNTNSLLPLLDFELIARHPKFWVGFSDTSALLQAITEKTGLVTYLGPSGISFCKPTEWEYSWQYLNLCLEQKDFIISPSKEWSDDLYFLREDQSYMLTEKSPPWKVIQGGTATGKIISSHLSTLLDLYGTEYFPDLSDVILCIEFSEEENTPSIFHHLTRAKQLGIFEKISALLIGRFSRHSGASIETTVEKYIHEQILKNSQKNIVIISKLDFGHTDPMFTLPNGAKCTVTAISPEGTQIHISNLKKTFSPTQKTYKII